MATPSPVPQFKDIVAKLKVIGSSWREWFRQLPLYQRIIATVGALTGSLLARYLYCRLHRKLNNFPPGPIGLPFIGYTYRPLDEDWHPPLYRYADEKEKVVMFYLVQTPMVMIANPETFAEIWRSEVNRNPTDTGDFPTPFAFEHVPKKWAKRRQLNSASFTSLMKSDYLDTIISALLAKQTFPDLDQQCSVQRAYYCREDIKWLGFCFLFGVFFGVNGDIPGKDDKEFHRLLRLDGEAFERFVVSRRIDLIVPFDSLRRAVRSWYKPWAPFIEITKMIEVWRQRAEQNGTDSNEDTYFNRMKSNVESGKMSPKEVVADAGALISAGLHITLTSIEMAVYHAAAFPEMQERVYRELAAHFEKYQGFPVKRMNELHVFRAFVLESLRYGGPVKQTLDRVVTKKKYKVGPYNVPKGATLLGASYSIHHDAGNFAKPDEFHVEHFLDDHGRFVRNKKFMLFGSGKRDCIGQSLAVKEMNCILSALLHRYKFGVAKDKAEEFVLPFDYFRVTPELPLQIDSR